MKKVLILGSEGYIGKALKEHLRSKGQFELFGIDNFSRKKNVEENLKTGFSKEKIPAVIRRCPKCNNLSLEYDIEKGRIKCSRCGFEENIPQIK